MKKEIYRKVSSGIKRVLGPKPLIHHSHRAALKIFEKFGITFEIRRFGESRLGLLHWPLRKIAPSTPVRRLVVAPGFGDTPLSWFRIFVALKPILRSEIDEVIFLDYPGYSGFLHDEAAFDSMTELTRVFGEVLDTLKPAMLLGHSLGGWLSAAYTAKRPDAVQKLVLVDPGGLVVSEEDRVNYRGIFIEAIAAGDAGLDRLAPHLFSKAPILFPFFAEEFFHFLKSEETRSFLKSFTDEHLLNNEVAKITADTTVVWGAKDTLTPAKWIDQWMERLPTEGRKTGVLIQGAGHSPQVEKPGVLIAVLAQIFRKSPTRDFAWLPLWKVVR